MLVAVFCAVVLMTVLDLRRPAVSDGSGARASWAWLIAAVLAAALPIGCALPIQSLTHVGMVPSFDALRPCVPPRDSLMRAHALVPLLLLRVLLPIAILVGIVRDRPAPGPRYLLGFALALATTVLTFSVVRALRGGADLSTFRTCGALTPEEGADAPRVREVLSRVVRDGRQEILHWRDLPRLPRPPWVRGEIAVTIAGEPWVLRSRGEKVIAEPDDPRRADRPLPALHFASVPSMAIGAGSTVLLDHRPAGKLYAVRVGSPTSLREIGPLVAPPRWPIALLLIAIGITLAWYVRSRPRPVLRVLAPYRTAPDGPRTIRAMPAFCAFLLIETSLTAMHALLPYL